VKEQPTPAPGGKLTDEMLNWILPSRGNRKFEKGENKSFLIDFVAKSKKVPPVGTYKTDNIKVLAPMPISLRRRR
jgi:hypothetical protein